MQRHQVNNRNNVQLVIGLSPDYNSRLNAIIELYKEGIYNQEDVESIVVSEFKKCLSINSYRT